MYMTLQGKTGTYRQGMGGFTLVELLIVIAIISIIAAIAIPSYTAHMQKTRRSDAKTILTAIAAREEQFFVDNRRYTDDFTELGNIPARAISATSVTSEGGYYTVTAEATTTTFDLTATPVAGGPQASDVCITLTLNEEGEKGFTPADVAVPCW